jgi:hypothetical protein
VKPKSQLLRGVSTLRSFESYSPSEFIQLFFGSLQFGIDASMIAKPPPLDYDERGAEKMRQCFTRLQSSPDLYVRDSFFSTKPKELTSRSDA